MKQLSSKNNNNVGQCVSNGDACACASVCMCMCMCVRRQRKWRQEEEVIHFFSGGSAWTDFFFLGSGKLITMSGDFFFKLLSIFFKKHVLFNYEGFFFSKNVVQVVPAGFFFRVNKFFFCFQCFLCNLCGIKYLGKTPPTIVTIHTTLAHTNIRQKKREQESNKVKQKSISSNKF